MDSDSLWPSDIAKVDEIRSPLAILKEQASQLGKATKNIIVAEVVPIRGFTHPIVGYVFNIVAPALANYRYQLFRVDYNIIDMYPVSIYIDLDIYKEMYSWKTKIEKETLSTEEDIQRTLKAIFGTKKTKKIINSLLAESGSFINPQE